MPHVSGLINWVPTISSPASFFLVEEFVSIATRVELGMRIRERQSGVVVPPVIPAPGRQKQLSFLTGFTRLVFTRAHISDQVNADPLGKGQVQG